MPGATADHHRSNTNKFRGILFSSIVALSVSLLIIHKTRDTSQAALVNSSMSLEKSTTTENPNPLSNELSFAWTNAMLSWQRTAYHFQPEKNWMNDPHGPLFYKGWYHLFYQYNPDSAVWGNLTWGHAVSRDLIHWLYLPSAMVRDQPYDINGVWTGSATTLPNGKVIMMYTGISKETVQVQNVAYPANASDPLLVEWVKDPRNPVITPPRDIGNEDFRDPTTAWLSPDTDKWRVMIGSKINKTGFSLVYETSDFIHYELVKEKLHQVPGTGMWECVDFFTVSLTNAKGLDTSASGPEIKHVMKVGVQDQLSDYYAIGTYDSSNNKWTPDDPNLDVGTGLRYDYGTYYASKSFYDQDNQRRILLAWVMESDEQNLDILKGWSGVQSIPRTIVYDQKTGSNILQWPVEEVESLRSESYEFDSISLGPGSVVQLKIKPTSQLDIFASFEIDKELYESIAEADTESDYKCTTSGGAANRRAFGPYGILVHADETFSELTPIYFYVTKGANMDVETHFCADGLRSSEASDVDKKVYGSRVPVLDGEKFSIRSLVDHSIVESFAQEGRSVITSRVYPTKAINKAARVYLFNNATRISVTASVKAWEMNSADIHHFPLDQL